MRPLARPGVQAALVTGALGVVVLVLLRPRWSFVGMELDPSGYWVGVAGPAHPAALGLLGAGALFSLALAYSLYRRSAPGLARTQARIYLSAFLWRDLLLLGGVLIELAVGRERFGHPEEGLVATTAVLGNVVLLAYGVLRAHLFDLDVRLRAIADRAALAFVFVAPTAALGWGAGRALGGDAGLLAAVATAGALALLPYPARLARTFAARAVPGSSTTPEALLARKLEVYGAALEEARDRGRSDPSDPDLTRLRDELGLATRDHQVLLQGILLRDAEPGPGTLVGGRYRILREIGRGATSLVFVARDEDADREVVLKRVLGQGSRTAEALARVEADASAAWTSDRLVKIAGVAQGRGGPYLVMEHMPGGDLASRISAGRLAERDALPIARDVASALAHLHAHGFVHRDVKPSNILFDAEGRARLADFTLVQQAVSGDTVGYRAEGVVGTFAYMAPEQARGLPASPASDVYALGATLYAALTGSPPVHVDGLSEHEARMKLVSASARLPLPDVSRATNAWLERALARDETLRSRDGGEAAAALHAAAEALERARGGAR